MLCKVVFSPFAVLLSFRTILISFTSFMANGVLSNTICSVSPTLTLYFTDNGQFVITYSFPGVLKKISVINSASDGILQPAVFFLYLINFDFLY